jgi:hypothetical protein
MAPLCSPFLVTAVLLVVPSFLVQAKINFTPLEEMCLERTGKLFEGNKELGDFRSSYAKSLETKMTSELTMTAIYPEEMLRDYERLCRANGGVLHKIKIDFFDCKLAKQEVELTLKNFANCLASVEECKNFDQENLLEEAWDALGLHCELEEIEEEKKSEYIPKEQQGKTKSVGSRFFLFILIAGIVGGVVYFVYHRKFKSRRLPWGGVTTSRFQSREGGGSTGFVSHYHMLSGEDEVNFMRGSHELQLSSTYNP